MIKKVLLLGFLFFLFQTSYSQYVPMPVDSALWKVNYSIQNFEFGTLVYKLNGDTIINSFNYSKIYLQDSLYGFMREEEKTVYFKPVTDFDMYSFFINCDTSEVVLYDFNLVLGDTFQLTSCYDLGAFDSSFVYVIDVDSIQMNEGDFRKRYSFASLGYPNIGYEGCGDLQWVEGLGNITHSPFYHPLDCFATGFTFACFKQGEQISYGDCLLYSNTTLTIEDIKVFPNPARDIVFISGLDFSQKYSIKIFDSYGRLVSDKVSEPEEIEVHHLTPGIYFVVIDVNKQKIVKKIVKF